MSIKTFCDFCGEALTEDRAYEHTYGRFFRYRGHGLKVSLGLRTMSEDRVGPPPDVCRTCWIDIMKHVLPKELRSA